MSCYAQHGRAWRLSAGRGCTLVTTVCAVTRAWMSGIFSALSFRGTSPTRLARKLVSSRSSPAKPIVNRGEIPMMNTEAKLVPQPPSPVKPLSSRLQCIVHCPLSLSSLFLSLAITRTAPPSACLARKPDGSKQNRPESRWENRQRNAGSYSLAKCRLRGCPISLGSFTGVFRRRLTIQSNKKLVSSKTGHRATKRRGTATAS